MDDALTAKVNALEGDAAPDDVPTCWNPGHVARRMVQAFEVLRSHPGRVGPQPFGSAWPTMLQEFADLVDAQAFAEAQQELARPRAERWSAAAIALADEALAWPLTNLADQPLRADAVLVWAFAKANKRSLRKLLNERSKRARAVAVRETVRINAQRDAARREAARQCAAWANRKLAGVSDPVRVRWIKENARIRFERAAATLTRLGIRPSRADRTHVLSREALDRHLPAALQTLSDRLAAAGVPVR